MGLAWNGAPFAPMRLENSKLRARAIAELGRSKHQPAYRHVRVHLARASAEPGQVSLLIKRARIHFRELLSPALPSLTIAFPHKFSGRWFEVLLVGDGELPWIGSSTR